MYLTAWQSLGQAVSSLSTLVHNKLKTEAVSTIYPVYTTSTWPKDCQAVVVLTQSWVPGSLLCTRVDCEAVSTQLGLVHNKLPGPKTLAVFGPGSLLCTEGRPCDCHLSTNLPWQLFGPGSLLCTRVDCELYPRTAWQSLGQVACCVRG